jgi:hemerythrin-like domain-containing protein
MPTGSAKSGVARRTPDAISLLTEDHRKVKRLLSALASTTERASSRREGLLKEVESEIKIHSQIEEEIFYPAYRNAVRKSDAHLYFEALEEHHVVDRVLSEIKAASVDSEEFGARAKVLKDLIEHHAGEEETQMFPKARKAIGNEKLRELGSQMQERKVDLQSGILTRAARTAGAAIGTVMSRVTQKKRAA